MTSRPGTAAIRETSPRPQRARPQRARTARTSKARTSRAGTPPTRTAAPRPGRRRAAATVLAVATALLASGCGVLPGLDGGSREPVKVMTFAPEGTDATNMPGMPAMAKAYARWVNANGGVDGHRLTVVTCNEKNTAEGASQCARQAVEEDVVAVVGSYSQHGRAFTAPLQVAGIPFVGGFGASEEEFTNFLSYPVNGGPAALFAGQGRQLADTCRRVAIVRPDSIAGDKLPELLDAGLAQGGHSEAVDVLAPDNATEYTRQADQARTKAGEGSEASDDKRPGCVTTALGDRTETFVDSFRRLPDDGRDIALSSVVGSVGQSLIDRTGGRSGPFEGAFITGWYPAAADPRWNQMKNVIDEHAFADNRVDPTDVGTQTTWIAYTVLNATIEAIDADEITAHAVSQTLADGLEVSTGGVTPTLRWDRGTKLGTPDFPRAVNRHVTFNVVREGRLVAQEPDFVNVDAILSAQRKN
ncbi:ABC transporter substrate-binding protein [Streptomyces sp. NPDC020412]|uniref:ABC transporter substrate-binding protein n=1 Tax=Streptomyces sp. NPDC020412 TaxID=3365073 RepID=UPI00379B4A3E